MEAKPVTATGVLRCRTAFSIARYSGTRPSASFKKFIRIVVFLSGSRSGIIAVHRLVRRAGEEQLHGVRYVFGNGF